VILPVAGVIAVVAFWTIAFTLPGPPPVINFAVNISIQYTQGSVGNNTVQFLPLPAVGEPGGIWDDAQYDSYGVDNHYPVYSDPPPSTGYTGYSEIFVKSKVAHQFTLGDYFNVWGEPLGVNDTYNIPASNVTGDFWSMCIGPSIDALTAGNWSQQVLTPNLNILLIYSTELNCAPNGAS
jgi:hypothetical protein